MGGASWLRRSSALPMLSLVSLSRNIGLAISKHKHRRSCGCPSGEQGGREDHAVEELIRSSRVELATVACIKLWAGSRYPTTERAGGPSRPPKKQRPSGPQTPPPASPIENVNELVDHPVRVMPGCGWSCVLLLCASSPAHINAQRQDLQTIFSPLQRCHFFDRSRPTPPSPPTLVTPALLIPSGDQLLRCPLVSVPRFACKVLIALHSPSRGSIPSSLAEFLDYTAHP